MAVPRGQTEPGIRMLEDLIMLLGPVVEILDKLTREFEEILRNQQGIVGRNKALRTALAVGQNVLSFCGGFIPAVLIGGAVNSGVAVACAASNSRMGKQFTDKALDLLAQHNEKMNTVQKLMRELHRRAADIRKNYSTLDELTSLFTALVHRPDAESETEHIFYFAQSMADEKSSMFTEELRSIFKQSTPDVLEEIADHLYWMKNCASFAASAAAAAPAKSALASLKFLFAAIDVAFITYDLFTDHPAVEKTRKYIDTLKCKKKKFEVILDHLRILQGRVLFSGKLVNGTIQHMKQQVLSLECTGSIK